MRASPLICPPPPTTPRAPTPWPGSFYSPRCPQALVHMIARWTSKAGMNREPSQTSRRRRKPGGSRGGAARTPRTSAAGVVAATRNPLARQPLGAASSLPSCRLRPLSLPPALSLSPGASLPATRPPHRPFPGDPRGRYATRVCLPGGGPASGGARLAAGRGGGSLPLSLPPPWLTRTHTNTRTHTRAHTRTRARARSILPSGLWSSPARASRSPQTLSFSPAPPHPLRLPDPRRPRPPLSRDGAARARSQPPAAGVTAPRPSPPGPRPEHHGPEGLPRRRTLKMIDAGGEDPDVDGEAEPGSPGLVAGP